MGEVAGCTARGTQCEMPCLGCQWLGRLWLSVVAVDERSGEALRVDASRDGAPPVRACRCLVGGGCRWVEWRGATGLGRGMRRGVCGMRGAWGERNWISETGYVRDLVGQ